jgi:hypothetical protein
MKAPPERKAPGAGEQTGRKLIASREYHALDVLQSNTVWAVWQHEAARLLSQYWCTNDPKHLVAFVVHVRGMRAYASSATQ